MDYHSRYHTLFHPDNSIFSSAHSSPTFTLAYSHFFAIFFCYLVGCFGLRVFYIVPVLLLLWNHSKECYDIFVWTTRLRIEYLEIKRAAQKHGESIEWLNLIVKKWWSCCDISITRFVQDWVEPIASRFKLEYVVESLKILTFNTGPYRANFSNLQILQKVSKLKSSKDEINVFIPITLETLLNPPVVSATEGRCTMAIEMDVDLDVPSTEFKMKAKLGGINQNLLLNVESFHLSGRAQCIFNADRRAPFPHIATADLCFLPTPKLKVNCRILKDKLDVSATPILKQIGAKYIEREFQRILVYPKKQRVDFTPTPPIGPEWDMLTGGDGLLLLSQGVLTVKIENVNSENEPIKKSGSSTQYLKLKLGSQKCQRHLSSQQWSSTFSFLVHDLSTEKLIMKLKTRRKMRQDGSVTMREISLFSLGIGQEVDGQTAAPLDKNVQMSASGLQLLFSLSYTWLPQFSLVSPIPLLDNSSMEDSGVLYIHVHGANSIVPHSSRAGCQPYCAVRQGSNTILKTHSVSGVSNLAWEKGTEILITSCRGWELTFDVMHDGGTLGSHDLLGYTSIRLSMGQPQIIQHRLPLTCPLRKFPTTHFTSAPCIYVSVVYRNVQSINLTRDSLQEAFFQRTRQQSVASCLDTTTKFLNPLSQGFEVTNAEMSSDNDSIDEHTHSNLNSYAGRVVSGLEESLLVTT